MYVELPSMYHVDDQSEVWSRIEGSSSEFPSLYHAKLWLRLRDVRVHGMHTSHPTAVPERFLAARGFGLTSPCGPCLNSIVRLVCATAINDFDVQRLK